MRYTVIWLKNAENLLIAIWNEASAEKKSVRRHMKSINFWRLTLKGEENLPMKEGAP
jgi:hypothetical protein